MARRVTLAFRDMQTIWVSHNRTLLTEIAKEARVSPQFVHQIFRGKRRSSDGRVERLLKKAGAPIA